MIPQGTLDFGQIETVVSREALIFRSNYRQWQVCAHGSIGCPLIRISGAGSFRGISAPGKIGLQHGA